MKRRIMVSAVVLTLLLMIVAPITASAAIYCGSCSKNTNWSLVCYGGKSYDSTYVSCATSGCSFYNRYNKTNQRCTSCKANYLYYGTHKHYQYHFTSSHNKSVCTY